MDETSTSTRPAEASGLHIHPPLLALLCFAGALALHLMLPTERTVYLHHVLGLLLVAGGVGLSFYAAAIFQARDTTKDPYGEPAKFVTASPYTFTRNPMYVGLTAVLLGFAVFFASPVMILAPIIFAVLIDRMVIPREEQTMERTFGAEYTEYQGRVRRWL
ncbi:MAG TPA: isoprenylcysteine carboxylmethyltransferase family protein [Candidatus Binataceae bacterium]|jgi:protein-S-isoprenylcysteine O-methyltransferase Ste14